MVEQVTQAAAPENQTTTTSPQNVGDTTQGTQQAKGQEESTLLGGVGGEVKTEVDNGSDSFLENYFKTYRIPEGTLQDLIRENISEMSEDEVAKMKSDFESVVSPGTIPEKYEFKVPEGMEIDASLIDALTPTLKELGITQQQAQKLADAYAPFIKNNVEAQTKAAVSSWEKQIQDWKAETTNVLGSNSKEEMANAARFINRFGSPKLREMLDDTGIGNHPELVKVFVKAGKAISEDSFVEPSKIQKPGGLDLKRMYDHTK